MARDGSENDNEQIGLPKKPIDRLTGPIERFLHVEAASGVVLLLATVIAIALANSSLSDAFLGFWKTKVGFHVGNFEMNHSLKHWINDGLMVIFFFVIGLEVKRELVVGELREMRRAALPIAAALGGMVVPAGFYLAFQHGQPGESGWGIPMATDIAFVVGCMAVLGKRVPHALRVTLLSLAIADDIGAILVIAIGYTESIDWRALTLGFATIGIALLFSRIGVRSILVYVVLGITSWLGFHESGVHATIAGVAFGLITPTGAYISQNAFSRALTQAREVFDGGSWEAFKHRPGRVQKFRSLSRETIPPAEYLEGVLHPWSSFVIMPIFALANAGVAIEFADLTHPIAIAIIVGLTVGKPVGIVTVSFVAVKLGLAQMPKGVSWKMFTGGGALAGIGFTMALFIADLALDGDPLDAAKVGVLLASFLALLLGFAILMTAKPREQ